jgi:hypothetical protein
MDKVRIKLSRIGTLHPEVNLSRLSRRRSKLFRLSRDISTFSLPHSADGDDWEFMDDQMAETVPKKFPEDVLFAITSASLEGNYYMRRLSRNRVCISLFEISEILSKEDIPLENYILKCIYEVLIMHIASHNNNDSLPESEYSYTHDDTQGCLFDTTKIRHYCIVQ